MITRRTYIQSIVAALALAAWGLPVGLQAQPPKGAPAEAATAKKPAVTMQSVDSRRGYVARIPAEATLDSARSGWSPERQYEIRTYIVPDAGMIRFTATVRSLELPSDTISSGAYTYTQADSATQKGTAKIRTYYLPTRNVRIEIIPFGLKGHLYTETSEKIFGSFRWKPGATTT